MTARETTDDITQRMRCACWMTRATDTHTHTHTHTHNIEHLLILHVKMVRRMRFRVSFISTLPVLLILILGGTYKNHV